MPVGDVRVPLRRSDVGVAEHLLDASQVGAAFEQVRREGMAEEMRVYAAGFEPGAVVVETGRPDEFYASLTELVASGAAGTVDEVTSPDDNLQAVFKYLVKT